MFLLGSAYPMGKFGLNASSNPILFGALRMGIVFLCLLPFCQLKIPPKKYFLPLFGFSVCMGAGVNMFLYLSIDAASILAPITIGAQLSIPFAIILSSLFLNESISLKKWILIFTSFFGIILIAFDPKIRIGNDKGNKINVINAPGYRTLRVNAAASAVILTKAVEANKTVITTAIRLVPVT